MADFTDLMAGITKSDDGATDGNGGAWNVTPTEDWMQGRTIYGGLSAALCLEGAAREFTDLPPLRSAQFAFIGPAAGRLNIQPRLLRKGKSATFIGVEAWSDDGLATRATLCYGAPRDSALRYGVVDAPNVEPPNACPAFFREFPGLNYVRHFDGRLAAGHFPFSRAADPTLTLWLRHRDERAPHTATTLVALADAPPPASMVLFERFAPISTMTWSIDFLTDRLETNDGWWLVRSKAENVAGGYSSQTMTVWNAAGVPVMVSRQNVAVFV